MNSLIRCSTAALALGLLAGTLAAQDLFYVRRTGHYGQIGLGAGNFTLTCDSGCLGDQLSGSDIAFMIGRNLAGRGGRAPARMRVEFGLHYMSSTDALDNRSSAMVLSGGLAVYVVGNLYVRGGAAYGLSSVQDSTGVWDGKGPGFQVGAGYDLTVGHTLALTPFVNFASMSQSSIEGSGVALGSTTSGSLRTLNFGVTASFIRGTFWCVTRSGQQVKVTRNNRFAAQGCLEQVRQRLER
jgi:hypothetical protein